MTLFYIVLMGALTWLIMHAWDRTRQAPKLTMARTVGKRVFVANFIFLQATLICKLVTVVIILMHIIGIAQGAVQIPLVRSFYNASGLFLCIAYYVVLFQWCFITMRVNLYGGKYGVRVFRNRVNKTQCIFNIVGGFLFSATLGLIIYEALNTEDKVAQAVSLITIIEFTVLLLSFIITGTIIIRNLWRYFESTYNTQRHSMIAALLLTVVSLFVLQIRYSFEYIYNEQLISKKRDPDHDVPAKPRFTARAALWVFLISDILPVVTQMLCIIIACWGQHDALLAEALYKPIADESTYAGSNMLQTFANDMAKSEELNSEIFKSDDNEQQSAQYRTTQLYFRVSQDGRRDT